MRGEGAYLFDPDGRRICRHVQQRPLRRARPSPRVADAMARQQATLNTHSRYLHEGVIEFAERLAALHGPQIESVVFSCSGTEANEVALRMARFATGFRRHRLHQRHLPRATASWSSALTHVGSRHARRPTRSTPSRFPETFRPIKAGVGEEALCEGPIWSGWLMRSPASKALPGRRLRRPGSSVRSSPTRACQTCPPASWPGRRRWRGRPARPRSSPTRCRRGIAGRATGGAMR